MNQNQCDSNFSPWKAGVRERRSGEVHLFSWATKKNNKLLLSIESGLVHFGDPYKTVIVNNPSLYINLILGNLISPLLSHEKTSYPNKHSKNHAAISTEIISVIWILWKKTGIPGVPAAAILNPYEL